MCVERNSINTQTGESKRDLTIHSGHSLLIPDFSPARLQVMSDVLDQCGQISFDGDTSEIIVAIKKGDSDLEIFTSLEEGISFGEEETVFVGQKNSNLATSFSYKGSRENQVLSHFHREVDK